MRFATVALIFSNAVIWLRCSLMPHLAASDGGWRLVAACPHKVAGVHSSPAVFARYSRGRAHRSCAGFAMLGATTGGNDATEALNGPGSGDRKDSGPSRRGSYDEEITRPIASRPLSALPIAGEQRSDLLDGKINFQVQVDLAKFCRSKLRTSLNPRFCIRQGNLVLAHPFPVRFQVE
jgi:hypothetical protein